MTWKRRGKRKKRSTETVRLELCDVRAAVFQAGEAALGHVPEELRAAKITRALTAGPSVRSLSELTFRTGLHQPDPRRAFAWPNGRLGPRATP